MENVKRHFTVSGIIFHKGKTLLLEHSKVNSWLCPGGHIEPNETPDEALLREIREETGLDIHFIGDIDKSLGDERAKILHSPFVIECELVEIPGDEHYHIDMIYLCRSDTDAIVADGKSKGIGWFTYEETNALNLFLNFRATLKKAFRYMRATSGIC